MGDETQRLRVDQAVTKLMKAINIVLWIQEIKLRIRMAWAVLRGRSVCYRIRLEQPPEGGIRIGGTSRRSGSFFVQNEVKGFTARSTGSGNLSSWH